MLDRTLIPESRQVNEINFLVPTEQRLQNGIRVFTINAGKQDLVRLEFVFENVNWDVTRPLQAISVSHLINNGTATLTARQIADQVDYYGAFLQTDYGADQSSIKVYTLNKHLPALLPVLWSILNESNFPEQELEIFKQNQQQTLKVSLQKNDFIARKTFAHAIFGDSTYGSNIAPSDYQKVAREDLTAYYQAGYQPENCTVFIAGKFDQDAFALLDRTFGGSWNNTAPAAVNTFAFSPVAGREILVERPDALQSAIRMGALSINRTHPDFAGFQVMNCLLGGYFGSRLMTNIREDKGYTYGIGSAIVSMKDAGYFFIATEVGAEVCSQALEEIEKEISLLKTEPVAAAELDLVRSYMLGSMLGSLENAFSHADKFKNIYYSGMDYDYYTAYIRTVKSITAGEIMALANTYLRTEDFVKVVVGKR